MAAFAAFLIFPILYAVYLSLFEVQHQRLGPDITVFAPLANYARAAADATFLASLGNIAKYVLIQVPLMVILSSGIALLLDAGGGRLRKFLRFSVFIPYAIPGVIAGVLWSYLYSQNVSPLNKLLAGQGLDAINFIDPSIILLSVANIIMWVATGYYAVILYASLRNIDRELYDAAAIDGATAWQVVWMIKLPLLRPTLTVVTVFSLIGAIQLFAEPYTLRSLGYVPSDITPNTVIFNAATRDGNYNYGAALAVVLAIISFAASLLFLWLSNREKGVIAK